MVAHRILARFFYCGFLEHLLTHFIPPRQASHDRLDSALGVDCEEPAGILGFLPGVELVDQIKPRPRDIDCAVCLAVRERGFHCP
jgi:hypothetical protein